MTGFSFEQTGMKDLLLVNPFYSEDNRGYFLKSYEREIFSQNNIEINIFEVFESLSKSGVVRGLHFQSVEPQSKLVRALAGEIFDVAVDLRQNSESFGHWFGVLLSATNRKELFVPKGFAHGFMVVSDSALVTYTCSGKYLSEFDTGIVWNDHELSINWPTRRVDTIIVSERDRNLQTFKQYRNSDRSF